MVKRLAGGKLQLVRWPRRHRQREANVTGVSDFVRLFQSTAIETLQVSELRPEAHGVVWRLPAYNIVHNILTNPIYAGAYAFGRTKSRVSVRRWTQAYPAWCAKAHGDRFC